MNVLITTWRALLLGGLLLGLPGRSCFLPAAFGQDAPPVEDKVYTYVEQMLMLPGAGGMAAIVAAIQQRLVVPAGTPIPTSRVFAKFTVDKSGAVVDPEIIQGTSPGGAVAVLAALRQLPTFIPGRQDGQLVRVSFTVAITMPDTVAPPPAPSDPATAQRTEAQTRQQGLARRQPGEADTTFLRRVLPESYPGHGDLVAYAWRPSAFGKQLLFSVEGTDSEWYQTFLYVLDPFEANTYTVQRLDVVVNMACDLSPSIAAIFFADINQDDQKELMVLGSCSSREPASKDAGGQQQYGHVSHQGTLVYRYVGLDSAGHPYYDDAATPPYLDGVETVADARWELAKHQRLRKPPQPQKAAAKTTKAAK